VGNLYKVKVCDFGNPFPTLSQSSHTCSYIGLSVIKPKATLKDTGGAKVGIHVAILHFQLVFTQGTPLYMAPEVMLQEEYDEKADVYR
jgi:serine/threonine protein kinase